MAREELEQAIKDLGLTVEATFVPWSKSRSFDPKAKPGYWSDKWNLNWRVTVKRDGRELLTTDYMAGMAHCPSYKQGETKSIDYTEEIRHEIESGRAARRPVNRRLHAGDVILPDTADVIHSLVSDSDVLHYGSFETWAEDFGYDVDSRKAEATYQACLAIALKLQAGLGAAGLERLREASQDY